MYIAFVNKKKRRDEKEIAASSHPLVGRDGRVVLDLVIRVRIRLLAIHLLMYNGHLLVNGDVYAPVGRPRREHVFRLALAPARRGHGYGVARPQRRVLGQRVRIAIAVCAAEGMAASHLGRPAEHAAQAELAGSPSDERLDDGQIRDYDGDKRFATGPFTTGHCTF